MSGPPTCAVWQPGECEGTPTCPPRCPRFVTEEGTPVLVEPRRPSFDDAADGLAEPDPSLVGPDDLVLAAVAGGTVLGYAWSRPGEDGSRRVRVTVAPGTDEPELPAELARQAAAYAATDGAGRLRVDGDPSPFETAGLPPVERDGEATVPLTGPAVADLTTPPGMAGGGHARAGGDLPAAAPDLRPLFDPGRVAVVGATDREGSVGRMLLENLAAYPGEVVPVTPRADAVFGRPAPDSLADAGDVDLAVVAVPPEAALAALETAGECGVGAVVVVSAGFDEAGDEGERHASRLREVADAHDLPVVGPNSMGVASTASGLNATFAPRHPPQGSVSLLSQSGAFITATVASAAERGLGFRHVVSVGNKAVLDAVDYLRYLDADPGTEVIAAYLEDVADGEAFVEVAREVTRTTPLVVLKSGRTEAGAAAAASHTGSLAGDEVAVDAAFDRAGVLRADSAEGLLDQAAALVGPEPDGDRVGIVTNAGGPGVLAADAADESGLPLASFDDGTRETLDERLPPTAATGNPVDVLGDAGAARFADAVDAVLADPGVDVGVVVTTPHPLVDYADLVAAVARRSLARDTPVVTCLMDGELDDDATRALRRYGVPNYPDPTRAAAAVEALVADSAARERPPVEPPAVDLDRGRIREIVERAREDGRKRLGVESLSLLSATGMDVPAWGVAESPAEAAAVADDVTADGGGQVVLKVASPDLAHKADVGGVRVGVDPGDAADAYEAVLESVRDATPAADVDGVVVQEQVDVDAGVETVVGATGSRFGPLVAFGLGGVLVEHVDDVAFALAPLDRRRARTLVRSIDAASVLRGARGSDPVDEDALVDAVVRVAALVDAIPEIADVDVNPLVASPDGVTPVDLQVELAFDD